MLLPLLLGCPGESRFGDPADRDSAADSAEPAWSEVDTGACEEDSSSFDACCWDGREERDEAYLLDRVGDGAGWDGTREGITVLESVEDLEAWWAAVGDEGRTDVDFATEVAVGWIGQTSEGCEEWGFEGLRHGDVQGTWYAGVWSWSYCGAYHGCEAWRVVGSVWVVPRGEIAECRFGGFCDG